MVFSWAKVSDAAPLGTAFTYQGHLYDNNSVANDEYDFQFKLYDTNVGGGQVGSDVNVADVDVIDGYFTVELDFGSSVFDGYARWLEIGVRPGASISSFTTLSPRQEITATPYANYASNSKAKQLIEDFMIDAGKSVSAGDVVSFVNGYIQKGFDYDLSYSAEHVFNSASTGWISVTALSETKFVVVYADSGNFTYGTAVVGRIVGNTITYGPEYVFNSGSTGYLSVARLSDDKFVVAYIDVSNSDYGTTVIGDVSGIIINFGSEYVFNSFITHFMSVAALSEDRFVVIYEDPDYFYYGMAKLGQVSGDVISYYPSVIFNPASTGFNSVAAVSEDKIVVAYRDEGNSNYGTAVIGNILGSALSFGAGLVFNFDSTGFSSVSALSQDKFVIAYLDEGNSNYGTTIIGEITDANIFFGTEYVLDSNSNRPISVSALSEFKFVVAYEDANSSDYGKALIGGISGDTITYGREYPFNLSGTFSPSVAAFSEDTFVVAFSDDGNSDYGTAVIGDVDSGKVIGIAKESGTELETIPVIIGGVSNLHSGLTPGVMYYGHTLGNLTIYTSDWPIGLAISTSEILLE